uniref:FlgD Ig-like domain-containing protein n=1 Tax=candidate division WOR-3 bacterium TaxID=2052148 RepID=A0A7V0Z7Q9_UNCW3
MAQSPQVQWARIYGGDGDDYTRAVLEFPDKGFIAIGSTNSSGSGGYDVYVFKVDSSGYPLWSKAYGGTGDDYGYSFCATSNKYLIVGSTDSYGHGMRDIFLIKIDENGDSIWTKTYGDSLDEIGYSIVSTGDGGFLICGTTNSSSAGGYDVLVMKLDSLGNEEWTGLYGVNLDESGFCVKQTADSGYVVCGTAYVNLLGYEWCLLRYNRRGNLVWDTFQGSLNDDYAYSIEEIGEKDYVIAGNFSYELYVVRADTGGLNIWMLMQGGAGTDCAYSIKQTSDNGYIIAGITNSYGPGDNNAYLIKTYPDQVGILESMINTQSGIYFNAFPSPFSDRLGIRYMIHNAGYRIQDTRYRVPDINLRIFDASGRMVRDFSRLTVNGERSTIIWDGTDDSGHRLPSWVYFVYFEADGYKKVEKVILLK